MRLLACLLLITSLVAQGAALPHSHSGSDIHSPAGHDLRPHFHLSSSHHARHTFDGEPQERQFANAQGIACCQGLPPCDHDHDAVYVTAGGDMNLVERTADCAALAGGASIADGGAVLQPFASVPYAPALRANVPIFLASTRLLV